MYVFVCVSGKICDRQILQASHELNQHLRSKHGIDMMTYYRSHIERPSASDPSTDKTIRRLQVLIKKLQNDKTSSKRPAAKTTLPTPSPLDATAAKSHPSAKWVNR